jgi:diguanylate cyclase (GGDEF)-like protein
MNTNPARDEKQGLGGEVVPIRKGRTGADKAPSPSDEWRLFDHTARRDLLTSLHGHPWFEEDLRGAAQRRRTGETPWVAVAAVQGLSAIEERLGAQIAADALRAVAVGINDALRAGDKIARIDEDRFGLIVDAPYAGEAISALERIDAVVRRLASEHPRWLGLSLRIGVAPLWDAVPAAALRQAEEALDSALARGGPVMMTTAGRPGGARP